MLGRTQNQFVAIAQVKQAGIALGKFNHKRYNALQDLMQAHLPYHETAHSLKQTELLLNAFQPFLDIFCL